MTIEFVLGNENKIPSFRTLCSGIKSGYVRRRERDDIVFDAA